MNVIKLTAENVKRLSAVEITPEGSVVLITGKNGAGKSSVLDSIAYALGGQALVPVEPIRQGETESKIMVDLGEPTSPPRVDLMVKRKFRRNRLPCDCGAGSTKTKDHTKTCASSHFGETTSVLVVTNKDGAKYPSPQSILDKLVGTLTFDPLAFEAMEPKAQRDTLCKLVGLDTTELDATRATLFQQRTEANRAVKAAEVTVASVPVFLNVPHKEVSIAALTERLADAEEKRTNADAATTVVTRLRSAHQNAVAAVALREREISELRQRLEESQQELLRQGLHVDQLHAELTAVEKDAESRVAAVPDTAAIRLEILVAEQTNVKVRSNTSRSVLVKELAEKKAEAEELTAMLKELDAAKETALAGAAYPVPGLSVDDNGVLLNKIPFAQASTAERLRVSVAIGLALNPTLKVLLIREGSSLDSESMKFLAEMAEAAKAQVWLERVADSADGVSIYIEDGTVG